MKAVLHLNEDSAGKISELMGNISNLEADERIEDARIKAVVNSNAVRYLQKDSEAAEYLQDYIGQDRADFLACSNSLDNFDISEDELIEGVEVVDSGIGSIQLLQDKGYRYTKI